MTDRWVSLVYHEVLLEEPRTGAKDWFAVSRAAFGRQLDAIRAAGYAGCSIEAALTAAGRPRVAITFDDGTTGHYEHAVPELTARGMTATFFVTTSWVGRSGYVTWNQLRAMREAGMEIGSHTSTHPFLSELSREALWDELATPRAELDRELKQETTSLAYPGGDAPRAAFRDQLARAGYRVVATSRWGVNHSLPGSSQVPLYVRRCTVKGDPSPEWLVRVITGDPWVGAVRRIRELALGALRSGMGPTRYTWWRKRVLGAGRPA